MKFIAADVETANSDVASICAIGLVTFEYGEVISEYYTLVKPHDYFNKINTFIHGIDDAMVEAAPTYAEIAELLSYKLRYAVVVTHSHFDRAAMHQASEYWDVAVPDCVWLDSARVARRTWGECARSGYGLADICKRIGYKFRHHHALEDARAAGHVLLAAMAETGHDLDGMLRRVRQPIDPTKAGSGRAITRDGNVEGALFGEVAVFTGTLEITRREAADLAASIGCQVAQSVTRNTTLLIVGDIDLQRSPGYDKSTKHRKAEALVKQRIPIRIIRETNFRDLVS